MSKSLTDVIHVSNDNNGRSYESVSLKFSRSTMPEAFKFMISFILPSIFSSVLSIPSRSFMFSMFLRKPVNIPKSISEVFRLTLYLSISLTAAAMFTVPESPTLKAIPALELLLSHATIGIFKLRLLISMGLSILSPL